MKADCSFVRANGLKFAYVEQGHREGPAVILLHGYTDSHRSFDLLRAHLPETWRVIAVSARGHGRSDKPGCCYRMHDFAADVAAFMDALSVKRAILVGHSMGSAIAVQTAAMFPDRVDGLVLMDGFADYKGNPLVAELEAAVAQIEDKVDPDFALAFQESTVAQMIPQTFLEMVVGESLRCPPHVWRAALRGQIDADILGAAKACRAPVLLLRGDKDAFVPLTDQFKLREALPSARIFSLSGLGHAPHWEAPEEIAQRLVAFVGEVEELRWA